jgi:hypothetical protein
VQAAPSGASVALYPLGGYLTTSGPDTPSPTVTFSGSGFTSDTQAFWDGAQIPTTFSSATRIAVQPPAADLARPGMHSMYVTAGPLTSNTVTVGIERYLNAQAAEADPAGQRLYVLASASPYLPAVPSDLLIFDMNTGDLVKTIAQAASVGSAIAVSANGQYVYFVDSAQPVKVRRYNTTAGAIDLEWALLAPPGASRLTVVSLATPPDSPETLIVSAQASTDFGTLGPTIAIYDGPHPRPYPSTAVNPVLPTGPMFATRDRIFIASYGYNLPCWEWLDFNGTGITGGTASCADAPPGAIHDHGLIYLTDGTRVMAATLPFTVPSYTSLLPAADLTHRRAFGLGGSAYQPSIVRFDLDTQQQSTLATLQIYGMAAIFVTPSGGLLLLNGSGMFLFP